MVVVDDYWTSVLRTTLLNSAGPEELNIFYSIRAFHIGLHFAGLGVNFTKLVPDTKRVTIIVCLTLELHSLHFQTKTGRLAGEGEHLLWLLGFRGHYARQKSRLLVSECRERTMAPTTLHCC
jgi:hypothetical protein